MSRRAVEPRNNRREDGEVIFEDDSSSADESSRDRHRTRSRSSRSRSSRRSSHHRRESHRSHRSRSRRREDSREGRRSSRRRSRRRSVSRSPERRSRRDSRHRRRSRSSASSSSSSTSSSSSSKRKDLLDNGLPSELPLPPQQLQETPVEDDLVAVLPLLTDSESEESEDPIAAEERRREERRRQREERLKQLQAKMQQTTGDGEAQKEADEKDAHHSPAGSRNGISDFPLAKKERKEDSREERTEAQMEKEKEEEEEGEEAGEGAGTDPKQDDDDDDDDFDMFADSPSRLKALMKTTQTTAGGNAEEEGGIGRAVDNFQDEEGYYIFRSGDILGNRYQAYAMQGKGVFSTVLRVKDLEQQSKDVVVKVMRNNDTMRRAGAKELEFLQLLAKRDPENRKHCIRVLGSFDHENHLCVVFEALHMNLREVIRKFGGIGLHMSAVQSFTRQLFVGLHHLKDCGIVHGDIKPDNILVNEAMNIVKICDLGSAGWVEKCEITPYLVSRFYRPPEVMIGAPYDCQVDIWSMGCVIFELFTGKILFRGPDNNSVLQKMLELKGHMSKRMIRRGLVSEQHFDENGAFLSRRRDPLTKEILIRPVTYSRPTRHLHELLLKSAVSPTAEDRRKIGQLADLLEKIFVLDPAHRITVEKAIRHPFLTG